MYQIGENLPEIHHDGFVFKLDYCEPTNYAKVLAKDELRETPENIRNGLDQLRSLLKEDGIRYPKDNDQWLLSFLRPAHFYPDSARQMIQNYFNVRRKYSEHCVDLGFPELKDFFHDFTGSVLPQRDQHGRRICVFLAGKYWDTQKYNKDIYLKSFFLQSEYLRAEPETQICGITIILDMLGLTMRQALLYTPAYAKCIADYIQEGMAIRLKGYHVVNQPKIFNILYAMIKPFVKPKYSNRVFFHGSDMSSLHRYISPDCLPECYGGTLKTAQPSYGPQFYELFQKYQKDYNNFMEYSCKY
ncbi:alpha-tocopherol transfer protein-like [Haematobia irritans]|uniref:alpha-tocopherol transfer protein-like n=1 Tax=Haematobia irritans TaxID=7368 RepID=UPI003F4F60BF